MDSVGTAVVGTPMATILLMLEARRFTIPADRPYTFEHDLVIGAIHNEDLARNLEKLQD
jgi:hypothetical protein